MAAVRSSRRRGRRGGSARASSQERREPGEAGDVDLGAQYGWRGRCTAGPLDAGVADEGGDVGGEGGGAQVEAGEQLVGEVEFVVGAGGSVKAETKARWAWAMARSPATPCCSASAPGGLDRRRPRDPCRRGATTRRPGRGGGGPPSPGCGAASQGGGEVAGEAGEVGQAAAAAGASRPPPSATCCMPRRESSVRPRSRWALAR